jgi:hypothetical protein
MAAMNAGGRGSPRAAIVRGEQNLSRSYVLASLPGALTEPARSPEVRIYREQGQECSSVASQTRERSIVSARG